MGNIDIAAQFRSWRDVRPVDHSFHSAGGACFLSCLLEAARRAALALGKSSLCVFVTSDNVTSTHLVADTLRASSVPISSALNLTLRPFFNPHPSDHWHSAELIEAFRYELADPQRELGNHAELFDWYLLGEAKAAVYTSGSTYATTARLRKGLDNMLLDWTSAMSDPPHSACECVPFDSHLLTASNSTSASSASSSASAPSSLSAPASTRRRSQGESQATGLPLSLGLARQGEQEGQEKPGEQDEQEAQVWRGERGPWAELHRQTRQRLGLPE